MMNRAAIIGVLLVSLGLVMGGRDASGAETPEEFYRGKTLIWLIVSEPGSITDLISRTIASSLAKEIGVKVRIEYRKTDEGINHLYNKATRDGLTLALKTTDAIIGNEILNAPGVHYETDKLNFVADVYPSVKVFQLSPRLPYKTPGALRSAKGLRGAATSAKGSIAVSSAVVCEILGLDGKVITGFNAKKDIMLAFNRGEADFMVTSDSTALRDEKDGYAVNLMVVSDRRSLAIPHVPTLSELGINVAKELKSVYRFITSGGMSVALPPGVPPERIEYLRKAFQSVGNNKELQKMMEKLTGQSTGFVPGKVLQQEMADIKADKELAAKLDAIFKKYTAVH